jgi:hypothetical protein
MLDSLLDKCKKDFPAIKRCALKNVMVLALCMLDAETVNLYKLKKKVGSVLGNKQSKPQSHYKRLIRLFTNEQSSSLWQDLLLFCVRMFRLKVEYLLLDGTSWQFGQRHIHLLVLSIVYKGVAIPVNHSRFTCWTDLQKKGISSTAERGALLKQAQGLYLLEGKTLIADREYIGKEWFEALSKAGIDFIVRLKRGIYRQYVDQANGHSYTKLVRKAKKGKRSVGKAINLEGMALTFVVLPNKQVNAKEELLYLLSSLSHVFTISEAYRLRWLTECCFKHMKSNGFHLEELGFKDENKIRLLLALVVFCYCLAIHEGLKFDKYVARKHYKDGSLYRQVSVFRNGLDWLAVIVTDIVLFLDYLVKEMIAPKQRYRSPKAIFV